MVIVGAWQAVAFVASVYSACLLGPAGCTT